MWGKGRKCGCLLPGWLQFSGDHSIPHKGKSLSLNHFCLRREVEREASRLVSNLPANLAANVKRDELCTAFHRREVLSLKGGYTSEYEIFQQRFETVLAFPCHLAHSTGDKRLGVGWFGSRSVLTICMGYCGEFWGRVLFKHKASRSWVQPKVLGQWWHQGSHPVQIKLKPYSNVNPKNCVGVFNLTVKKGTKMWDVEAMY